MNRLCSVLIAIPDAGTTHPRWSRSPAAQHTVREIQMACLCRRPQTFTGLPTRGWGRQADVLAAKALADNDPTGWFEPLYAAAAAGEVPMPWDREGPREALREWAAARALTGDGRRALVIGCGLGADSKYISSLGFDTDAFDISETAIRTVRARYPGSAVRYRTADLLDPPTEWIGAYDLVVEILTVQALPVSLRREAIAAVRRLVGPGGTLIVIMAARDADDGDEDGPPWPLTRAEMESFAADGLSIVQLEEIQDPRLWRAELRQDGPPCR